MPAGNLRAWLDGARDRLRWVDYAAYAMRVFASGNAQWLTDPHIYTGGIAQAQSVVGTEVLSVEVLAPYLALLETDTDAPSSAVQAMFEQEAPAAFVAEVVDALAHSFAGSVDLVLKIPSPGDVLRAAGLEGTADFDDLDDTAIALANTLRKLSERPISGILITTSVALTDDETEALESVVSAARHYDWSVCLCYEHVTSPHGEQPSVDCDAVLYPACTFAAIAGAENAGGGLDPAFWSGDAPLPDAARYLAYGVIPADAQPETVVARAAALQSA